MEAAWAAPWMAKRFTATEKWRDPWFRALSPQEKCAWQYLCDECDVAGVIQLDRELANFLIGGPVDWDTFLASCGNRVEVLDKRHLWISGFCEFQYGTLSENSRPHQAVIKLLEKRGLKEKVFKGYPRGIHTPKKKTRQEQDKDKDSEGGCKGETAEALFERFWKSYPSQRRGGRKTCRKAWDQALGDTDAETLIAAATEYAASPVGRGQFAKSPAAWLNGGHWTDDRLAWQHADRQSHAREITPAMLGIDEPEEHPF